MYSTHLFCPLFSVPEEVEFQSVRFDFGWRLDRAKPHINKRAIGSRPLHQPSSKCTSCVSNWQLFCFLTILSTSHPSATFPSLRPIHFIRTSPTLAHEASIYTFTMVGNNNYNNRNDNSNRNKENGGATTAATSHSYSHRNTQEHLVPTKHFITCNTFHAVQRPSLRLLAFTTYLPLVHTRV